MPQLDRAALDKLRQSNNLLPLTDEEFASLSGNGHSDKEKEAQAIEAKRLEDERIAKEKLELEKNTPTPAPIEAKELTDDELMAILEKKTGRKVASWDDLKPKAEEIDLEKQKEEREADKLSWAFKNKVVNKKDYEGYIADSKDAKSLVYRLRLQEALKEDPNLNQEEFQAEFDEEFGVDQKPETRRYKNGQQTLNRLASEILKSTYGSVYSIDDKYSQFEQTQNAKREQEKKILDGAPVYKQNLDKVKVELKKIKAHITETDEFEVEVLDESIDKVIGMMSNPDWASQQILKGATYEELKDIAYTTVLKENFPMIAYEIAKQYKLKHAAGTKGIIKKDSTGNEEPQLNEQWQVMKNLIEKSNPVPAATN